MSYDFYLEIDTGAGETVECYWANYTSNLYSFFRDCFDPDGEHDHWTDVFHGKRAGHVAAEFVAARERASVLVDVDSYNPANGWGNTASALVLIAEMAEAGRKHPNAVWKVWR